MKKINIFLLIFFILSLTIDGYTSPNNKEKEFDQSEIIKDYEKYDTLIKEVYKKFKERDYVSSTKLLEKHLSKFPEKLHSICLNLSFSYGRENRHKEGVKILEYGLNNGVWFNKWSFESKVWAKYKDLDSFKVFLKHNELKQKKAQENSKPDILIVKPENFDSTKKYPLHIALHGGGGNIQKFKELWNSNLIEKEYITAYLQSSQIVSMDGYSWDNMEIVTKELNEAYKQIKKEYKIDETNIIIGGFSSGGQASLEVIFRTDIPIKGFIILSPPKPEGFNDQNVKNLKNKNVSGVIITNSGDPRYEEQQEMQRTFKKLDIKSKLIITEEKGHWFPKNLGELIDDAILFIN